MKTEYRDMPIRLDGGLSSGREIIVFGDENETSPLMAEVWGKENASRLVACWNACAGIPTADLENAQSRPNEQLTGYGKACADRGRLAEQNRELVEALRDLAGSAMAIRKGFCTDNPYRKHSDSHENWDSAMSENADLFDAAEENALAVLAKATA